ncbi:MAG: DUF2163 domain-containing protein [Acidobacteria bacterium]|nr:DUF2163 domain-containing protein [Acidobacteriota bacterium]
MKQYLSGAGVDTSAAVRAHLRANKQVWVADLILIGEPDDPKALWLTNFSTPLQWSLWGTFKSTVLKRGSIRSAIGLEAESLDLTWSPRNRTATGNIQNTSAYELARVGFFDNMRFRMWRTVMPTPGDADTFGAAEWFAGWIGDAQSQPGAIQFSINSYLYALDQKVPSGVIEVTNTVASYSAGRPPAHDRDGVSYSVCPQFVIGDHPQTTTMLIADQRYPNDSHVFSTDALNDGYVVFMAGSTLERQYSVIGKSYPLPDGPNTRQVCVLYSPLPWVPSMGDRFYVTMQAPINQADGDYYGFPYVPAPETAA